MSGTTATRKAATGITSVEFANERGSEVEGEEVTLIGPSFPLWPQRRADISNEKSPASTTVELIFAPAAAALEIIKGTGNEPGEPLANAGYDPEEPRVPAGQTGGGRWTRAGVAGGASAPPHLKGLNLAPQPVLSGPGNFGPLKDTLEPAEPFSAAELGAAIAKYWKGFGKAITETVCGLWNTLRHPVTTAEGAAAGASQFAKDPLGVLKAIGRQIANDFTGGDMEKAGKLVGLALLSMAAPESEPEELAALASKVEAAAAGRPVTFTAEEAEFLDRTLKPYEVGGGHHIPAKEALKGDRAYKPKLVLAIPKSELKALGIRHEMITGAQKSLYQAYAKTGRPLTWEATQSIETQALVKAGMKPGAAQAVVAKAITALKDAGVKGPTKIPWGRN